MTLSDSEFVTKAMETLDDMMGEIEDVLGDHLDIDLLNGILGIELDGGGEYVINAHAPNRQIWMSSPFSGATHYDYAEGAWTSSKTGGDLKSTLAAELAKATGESFSF
jgi:frataxin